jgi:hypothetical protein
MKTTRRKLKAIGTQNYINSDTGELVPMRVIEVEERDANFKKLWVGHVLDAIDEIGNKKMQLLMWLFDQADAYNRIIGTTREIADAVEMSPTTVQTTLSALAEKDILQRQTNVITLNPNVIFKGSTSARMDVLIRYRTSSIKEEETTQNDQQEVS